MIGPFVVKNRPAVAAVLLSITLGALPTGAPPRAQSARPLVWTAELRGEGQAELRWPVAVAAASAREIAVADVRGARLVVFENDEKDGWRHRRTVGLPAAPRSVAYDGTRYVVSLRGAPGLVATDGETLRLRNVALPRGAVAGALAPVPGGGVLVHDVAGAEVLRLGTGGSVESRVPAPGRIVALAATSGGGFDAVYPDAGQLVRFAADGTERERIAVPAEPPVPAWPVAAVVGPGGDRIVVDRHAGRLVVLDGTGRLVGSAARRGWEAGLLWMPAGIALLPDGSVAVADLGNGRVQLFRRAVGATP